MDFRRLSYRLLRHSFAWTGGEWPEHVKRVGRYWTFYTSAKAYFAPGYLLIF